MAAHQLGPRVLVAVSVADGPAVNLMAAEYDYHGQSKIIFGSYQGLGGFAWRQLTQHPYFLCAWWHFKRLQFA